MTTTTRALNEAGERVSRYLVFESIVNVSSSLLMGIGLHFIRIPNPILWGALSGLLRYVPYVGPITATALPTVVALALFPGWHRPL